MQAGNTFMLPERKAVRRCERGGNFCFVARGSAWDVSRSMASLGKRFWWSIL